MRCVDGVLSSLQETDNDGTQFGKRKNMLEIELKESLRRRQDELRTKIEKLGEAEAGDASAAEDLETRNRELKSLNNTIEGLQKKLQGI